MAATESCIRIETEPGELTEGLFGQIILWAVQTLPGLYDAGVFPAWAIRSDKYGRAPDYLVIPGVLDLAYPPPPGECGAVPLLAALRDYGRVLGNDWDYMHRVWDAYFRIPARVVAAADTFGDLGRALGLHYRGTDKNTDPTHTNPVSRADFLRLAEDFVRTRTDIDTLFVATDEFSFVEEVGRRFPGLRVVNTGEVATWNDKGNAGALQKGDHAVLDCLLLSRCRHLLKCQSALSAFAKVLNPRLDAYRVAASKMFADIPYFPDAYLPRLTSDDPACRRLLDRLMAGDWTADRHARAQFARPFQTMSLDRIKIPLRKRVWRQLKAGARTYVRPAKPV